jgi:hypothetical protein
MLVPKELKFEHTGGVKAMTDEQLERGIELIQEMLAQREAGAWAKVVEGVAEPVPPLPPPSHKARRKVRRSDRADSGLAARIVGTDAELLHTRDKRNMGGLAAPLALNGRVGARLTPLDRETRLGG